MGFSPDSFQQMAGLILYYDTQNWMYALISWDEEQNCRTLRVLARDNGRFSFACPAVPLPDNKAPLMLAAEVERDNAQFYYALRGQGFTPWAWGCPPGT